MNYRIPPITVLALLCAFTHVQAKMGDLLFSIQDRMAPSTAAKAEKYLQEAYQAKIAAYRLILQERYPNRHFSDSDLKRIITSVEQRNPLLEEEHQTRQQAQEAEQITDVTDEYQDMYKEFGISDTIMVARQNFPAASERKAEVLLLDPRTTANRFLVAKDLLLMQQKHEVQVAALNQEKEKSSAEVQKKVDALGQTMTEKLYEYARLKAIAQNADIAYHASQYYATKKQDSSDDNDQQEAALCEKEAITKLDKIAQRKRFPLFMRNG